MIKKIYYKSNNNEIITNMVNNNEIKNLLKYKIVGNEIIYKIDGKYKLKDILSGINNIDKFIGIFENIVEALIELKSYMISEKYLYLTLEDIYIDIDENIYFKINSSIELKNDIRELYREVLKNICFDIDGNTKKILYINNYFNSSDYTLEELNKKIKFKKVGIDSKMNIKKIDDNKVKIENQEKKIKKIEKFKDFFNINKFLQKKDKIKIKNNMERFLKFTEK